jgi:hypothetical protein
MYRVRVHGFPFLPSQTRRHFVSRIGRARQDELEWERAFDFVSEHGYLEE